MSDISPKKRGRKPKNKIVKTKSISNINKNKDNQIICIKLKADIIDEGDVLPGYSLEKYELKEEHKNIHCWNCCFKLDKFYKSIPIKYTRGTFYIYGHFCDLSCSLRYLLDNFNGRELWEKYELFNFYCLKLYGKDLNINPAPNRLSLQTFGGNLTVEEYKKNNISYNEINIPPIIPVNNPNLNYENTKVNEKKGELKLYRKKKDKDKDGILDNMKVQ